MPKHVDAIYAVVDTAVKDGKEHDGTAVVYFARSKYVNHPLIILDWDLIQIKSNMLESWIPNVFAQCQYFAKLCHAKPNSQIVVFIEDKASGSMLLQNCAAKGLPAEAIPGNVTSVGKDARVIGCSGAVYRGEVKLSETAFNKATTFKGVTRNHLIRQVCSYAIGDPKSATRADDLSDCASYGILLGLGGVDGF
jgi:phage terminase large subunit-like protein